MPNAPDGRPGCKDCVLFDGLVEVAADIGEEDGLTARPRD